MENESLIARDNVVTRGMEYYQTAEQGAVYPSARVKFYLILLDALTKSVTGASEYVVSLFSLELFIVYNDSWTVPTRDRLVRAIWAMVLYSNMHAISNFQASCPKAKMQNLILAGGIINFVYLALLIVGIIAFAVEICWLSSVGDNKKKQLVSRLAALGRACFGVASFVLLGILIAVMRRSDCHGDMSNTYHGVKSFVIGSCVILVSEIVLTTLLYAGIADILARRNIIRMGTT